MLAKEPMFKHLGRETRSHFLGMFITNVLATEMKLHFPHLDLLQKFITKRKTAVVYDDHFVERIDALKAPLLTKTLERLTELVGETVTEDDKNSMMELLTTARSYSGDAKICRRVSGETGDPLECKTGRSAFASLLLHMADVSASLRPFEAHLAWSLRVTQEFNDQRKIDKKSFVSPAYNPNALRISQIRFIGQFISPYARKIAAVVKIINPGTALYWEKLRQQLLTNTVLWSVFEFPWPNELNE